MATLQSCTALRRGAHLPVKWPGARSGRWLRCATRFHPTAHTASDEFQPTRRAGARSVGRDSHAAVEVRSDVARRLTRRLRPRLLLQSGVCCGGIQSATASVSYHRSSPSCCSNRTQVCWASNCTLRSLLLTALSKPQHHFIKILAAFSSSRIMCPCIRKMWSTLTPRLSYDRRHRLSSPTILH